jgi:hypothetical protein
MGFVKKLLVTFLNKRHYYRIKMYSYYKKDLWGFLRLKRLYKYKRVIYSILRLKKRFYGIMLYKIYQGIKFFNKKYRYRGNLYLVKKRLKLFYGHLKDKYIGKLGSLVKRKYGELINYFYALLERRVDVLLYRSYYSLTVRLARNYILQKQVYCNKILVKNFSKYIYIGDYLYICKILNGMDYFFFRYGYSKFTLHHNERISFYLRMVFHILKWRSFEHFYLTFIPIFFKPDHYLLLPKNRNQLLILIGTLLEHIYVFFRILIKRFRILYKKGIISNKLKINKLSILQKENLILLKRNFKFKQFRFPFLYKRYIETILFILQTFWEIHENVDHAELYRQEFLTLYGLLTFKFRVKKLFWYLKPRKFFNIGFRVPLKYRRFQRLGFKRYRKWNFSRLIYSYLKKLDFFCFIYKGYLAHMEVNYKIHVITLIYNPTVKSVTYSFGINKFMFFEFFRIRAYF